MSDDTVTQIINPTEVIPTAHVAQVAPVAPVIQTTPVAPSVQKRVKPAKEPFISAILSFFIPGAGQFYNGHAMKGAILLISIPILLLAVPAVIDVILLAIFRDASVLLVDIILEPILGLFCLIIWAFNVYDAYKGAEKVNAKNDNEAYI